jgi:hypothetical protein
MMKPISWGSFGLRLSIVRKFHVRIIHSDMLWDMRSYKSAAVRATYMIAPNMLSSSTDLQGASSQVSELQIKSPAIISPREAMTNVQRIVR